MSKSNRQEAQRISQILSVLQELYPKARPELNFTNPYETLVATMLSAQSTDVQVNKVTPAVFRDFPTVQDMANTKPEILLPYVRSCGFRSKATNIVLAARDIVERFDGQVPGTMEGLMSLKGVGRKTANVVLANAFDIPAMAVDTHVFRVSNRLGLAHAKNVEKTEEQLMKAIPKALWNKAHHWLIFHGRRVCKAQRPLCGSCALLTLCENPVFPESNPTTT
ncbi:MAG: endonuclease III [Clostridiales bacterium]|nr:endonuclease III [Clostridiales bacterium]